MDVNVRDLAYEELFKQYGRLIYRYCAYMIPGLDRDDLFQELSMVLVRCQQLFNPDHARGAKFSTYFVNAMKWKLGNLRYRATKRIDVWLSLEDSLVAPDGQQTGRMHEADPRADAALNEAILELDLVDLPPKALERCRTLMHRRNVKGLTFRIGEGDLVREVQTALEGYNE